MLAQLEPVKRACYVPRVEAGADEPKGSKFSGMAYLQGDESWPKCGNCQQPMQLFLQLNGNDLPVESGRPFGDGVMQFFYCTGSEPLCEVECEAFFPFSRSTLLRVISDGEPTALSASPVKDAFPVRTIVGWEALDDYPNWEELKELGIELTDDQFDELAQAGFPRVGDKLYGWPAWVQGIEYPNCPTCGTTMRQVFQLDSNCNLPHLFGDVGCGHITQCPKHPSMLAFGWACS